MNARIQTLGTLRDSQLDLMMELESVTPMSLFAITRIQLILHHVIKTVMSVLCILLHQTCVSKNAHSDSTTMVLVSNASLVVKTALLALLTIPATSVKPVP